MSRSPWPLARILEVCIETSMGSGTDVVQMVSTTARSLKTAFLKIKPAVEMVDFHISVGCKDEGGAEEPVIGWVQLSGQSEVSSSVTFSNHNKTSRV